MCRLLIVNTRRYILLSFAFMLTLSIYGQKLYKVNLSSDKEIKGSIHGMELDSVSIMQWLNKTKSLLVSQGHIAASIDTCNFFNIRCGIHFYVGEKYAIEKMYIDSLDWTILSESGILRFKWNTVLDTNQVYTYMNSALEFLVNHGYPFAEVTLKDVQINEGKINARLVVNEGKYIAFGEIKSEGRNTLTSKYLSKYLEIEKGDFYQHAKVLAMRNKIKNLAFVEEFEPPVIRFINEEAIVYIPLKPKKASVFDFIIGLAPAIENGNRKWNVNGEFLADMYNKLGAGERMQIKLKRLNAEDQSLNILAAYPYIFNTPLGLDTDFSIIRNRNKSIDLNWRMGIQYLISGNKSVKMYWNIKTSRLSDVDSFGIKNTLKLPIQLDYNYKGGGINFQSQNLDYRFNPRRGWFFDFYAEAGQRRIIKNNSIISFSNEDVDFNKAYDSLKNNTLQLNLALVINRFIPISTWAALKFSLNAGYKYNNGRVLDNELYRIGGNKLLRGFDELSIVTDLYAVLGTEFRLLLDQNSFLTFPLIDFSRHRIYTEGERSWDEAIGLGVGLNFASKAGIFNITFSAGKRLDTPFDFSRAKIHFGFVSVF